MTAYLTRIKKAFQFPEKPFHCLSNSCDQYINHIVFVTLSDDNAPARNVSILFLAVESSPIN